MDDRGSKEPGGGGAHPSHSARGGRCVHSKARGWGLPEPFPSCCRALVNRTFRFSGPDPRSPQGPPWGLPLQRPFQLRVPSRLWCCHQGWQKLCPARAAAPPARRVEEGVCTWARPLRLATSQASCSLGLPFQAQTWGYNKQRLPHFQGCPDGTINKLGSSCPLSLSLF